MNGGDPDILGSWTRSREGVASDPFVGTPGKIAPHSDPVFATFTLFQRNCENVSTDKGDLRAVIHTTLSRELNGALQQNVDQIPLVRGAPASDELGPEDRP